MRTFTIPDMHQIDPYDEPDLTPINYKDIHLSVGEKPNEARDDIRVVLLNGVHAGYWFEQLDRYEPDTHLVFSVTDAADIDVPLPKKHHHVVSAQAWTKALVRQLQVNQTHALALEDELREIVDALEAITHPEIRDMTAKLIDRKLRTQRNALRLAEHVKSLVKQSRT